MFTIVEATILIIAFVHLKPIGDKFSFISFFFLRFLSET